jgi:arylsulfatase A
MNRISVLLLMALVALDVSNLSAAAARPNIVVIYTDDQGFGDASCYNPQSKIQTPHLDRLATGGLRFTDAHCSDTVCTPSRFGLLTGRYSWRTTLKQGVFGAERACLIADGRMTLASLLRDHGYATALVGKWHLGMDFPGDEGARDWSQPVKDMPLDKGFDYFYGIPASLNYGVLAWFEGRFAKVPPTVFTKKKPNELNPGDYRIMPPYEPALAPGLMEVAPDFVDGECLTRFTDKALAWIKTRAAAAREGQPFFLYLPYTSPHLPVIPLEQFRGMSGAGAYGDFMLETDWHVGRLLDLLDAEQLTRDTLIVFSSDNGPENPWRKRIEEYQHSSSGPYRDGKRSIYEGGHRVPFIVRWPAQVKAGGVWAGAVC